MCPKTTLKQQTDATQAQPVVVERNDQQQDLDLNMQPQNIVARYQRMDNAFSKRWDFAVGNQIDLDAGTEAQNIVREFNEGQAVGSKSKSKRTKQQSARKKLFLASKKVLDAQVLERINETEVSQLRQPLLGQDETEDETQDEDHEVVQQEAVPAPKLQVRDIKTLFNTGYNFSVLKEDSDFIKHYGELYKELEKLSSLKPSVDAMTEEDYDALKKEYGRSIPKIDEIKAKANEYDNYKKYYDARLRLIANPFYIVLRPEDTASMTEEALQNKIAACKADGRTSLARYLQSTLDMMRLEKAGLKVGEKTDKKKHSAFRKDLYDGTKKHHKGYFEFLSVKGEKGVDGGIHLVKAQERDKDLDVKEEKSALIQEGIYASLEARGEGKFKLAKASGKFKNDFFEIGGNLSVGAVSAEGAAGGYLGWGKSEGPFGKAGANVGVKGEVIKGRIKAALHYKKWIGGDLKLSASGPSATAEASANVGKFAVDTTEGVREVKGIGGMLKLEGSLASVTGSGGFTLFGLRFGASITGSVGTFGGNIGGYLSTGRIGCNLGFLAGLGLNVNFDVDYSYWSDKIAEKLTKYGFKGAKFVGKKVLSGAKAGGKFIYHLIKGDRRRRADPQPLTEDPIQEQEQTNENTQQEIKEENKEEVKEEKKEEIKEEIKEETKEEIKEEKKEETEEVKEEKKEETEEEVKEEKKEETKEEVKEETKEKIKEEVKEEEKEKN